MIRLFGLIFSKRIRTYPFPRKSRRSRKGYFLVFTKFRKNILFHHKHFLRMPFPQMFLLKNMSSRWKKLVSWQRQGELLRLCFHENFRGNFQGSSCTLQNLSRKKKSCAIFVLFRFWKRSISRTSPEMMVRVENRKVHLRPISGNTSSWKGPRIRS